MADGMMNQQELEAWIAANGGAEGVQFHKDVKNIPNPITQMFMPDGVTKNPLYDARAAITAPPTITVTTLSWTNRSTGAQIAVLPQADGNYKQVALDGPDPTKAKTISSLHQDPQSGEWWGLQDGQWVKIPGGPGKPEKEKPVTGIQQDPETGAWWGIQDGKFVQIEGGPKGKAPTITNITQDPGTGKWKGIQNGQWVDVPGPGPGMKKSYVQVKQDEVDGSWWGLTPDGQWEKTAGEGAGPRPAEKPPTLVNTGNGTFATPSKDEKGNVVLKPVEVQGGNEGEPPGRPQRDWTPGNVANSLAAYSAWLTQQVSVGTIKPATATRLMQAERELAQTAVTEQGNAAQVASSVYGHQSAERNQDAATVNSRLSASTTGFTSILQAIQAGAKAQPKGSNAAAMAFRGLMEQQIAHARAMGGLEDVPRTPVPERVQPYMTITTPGGGKVEIHNQQPANPYAPSAQDQAAAASGAVGPQPALTDQQRTDANNLVETVRLPGIQGDQAPPTLSGQAAASPAGQLPPAIAEAADSRPTGNSFADTEMMLTSAGIDPKAIQIARQMFLSGTAGPSSGGLSL